MRNKEQRPETQRAWLICSEYCKRPTAHDYDHARLVIDKTNHKVREAGAGDDSPRWYELIFKCEVCGASRTWGTMSHNHSHPEENPTATETRIHRARTEMQP